MNFRTASSTIRMFEIYDPPLLAGLIMFFQQDRDESMRLFYSTLCNVTITIQDGSQQALVTLWLQASLRSFKQMTKSWLATCSFSDITYGSAIFYFFLLKPTVDSVVVSYRGQSSFNQ